MAGPGALLEAACSGPQLSTSAVSQMNSPAQESILNSLLAIHSETNLASFTCLKQAPAT